MTLRVYRTLCADQGVEDAIHSLWLELLETLGGRASGIYVFGSLALGDFDPDSSDIDVLVTTEGALSDTETADLQKMHERVASHLDRRGSKWGNLFEVTYLPAPDIWPPAGEAVHVKFFPAAFGALAGMRRVPASPGWTAELWTLRERGLTLFGPPARELLHPIGPEDLRAAMAMATMEPGDQGLAAHIAWRRDHQSHVILTACRILLTYECGEVVSKPAAGRWAIRRLGGSWADRIDRAISERSDPGWRDPVAAQRLARHIRQLIGPARVVPGRGTR